jgi:hypothetical protein
MALPYFGEWQPGDTYYYYYYTPLNIYNIGMVDASEEQDKLYCHIYQEEGDGKKGGNNVASLAPKEDTWSGHTQYYPRQAKGKSSM